LASKKEQKKAIKEALQDSNLQKAIERASARHFEKFCATTKDLAWPELKEQAQAIRKECLPHLPQLIERFKKEAEKSGASVYEVSTSQEALSQIEEITSKKKAKLIIKAKSMVSEEIGLNSLKINLYLTVAHGFSVSSKRSGKKEIISSRCLFPGQKESPFLLFE
jgi:L-lactate dehydrogenase complex protein LldF